MKWRDFDCYVVINGRIRKPLSEYEERVDLDHNTTSCWIPSERGKTYQVRLKMDGSHPGLFLYYDLFVDNQLVHMGFSEGPDIQDKIEGMEINGGTNIRKFKFASLQSTDDDGEATRHVTGIGTIRLEIFQCEVVAEDEDHPGYEPGVLDNEPKINETHKKGGLHCTSLGQPQRYRRRSRAVTHPIPAELDEYRHVFIFNYRPIDYLQAKGIVPCPRRSKRVPTCGEDLDRDLEGIICIHSSDDEDEVEEVQDRERIRMLEEQQRLVEQRLQEGLNNINGNLKRLKAESSRLRKRVKQEYQQRLGEINGQVFEISD